MDMKTWLRQATNDERQALAAKAGYSVGYLYLIAGKHRHPRPVRCRALVEADPKLTLWELRPDIWDPPAEAISIIPSHRSSQSLNPVAQEAAE